MPYSDSTTTRVPSRRACAISSPQTRVDRPEVLRDRRVVGPEPLEVVVEVRQVDERQRRLLACRRRGARSRRSSGSTRGRRPAPRTGRAGTGPGARSARRGARRAGCRCRGSCARRPGTCGRGVTARSAALYMLYHQKSLAQVKAGSRRWAASQIFSPATSWFDCRQSHTSASVAEVPAVARRAVVARQEPGDEGGLHRAGDRRQDRAERPRAALAGEGARGSACARRRAPGSARRRRGRPSGARRAIRPRRRIAVAPAGSGPGGPVRSAAPVTRGAWPRRTELPSKSWL